MAFTSVFTNVLFCEFEGYLEKLNAVDPASDVDVVASNLETHSINPDLIGRGGGDDDGPSHGDRKSMEFHERLWVRTSYASGFHWSSIPQV